MARRRSSKNRRRGTTAPGIAPVPERVAAAEAAGQQRRRSASERVRLLGIGILIGAVWGVLMCLILLAAGRIDGPAEWAVRIASAAGIGMVVATVYGTVSAVRTGEPAGRLRFWRARRD